MIIFKKHSSPTYMDLAILEAHKAFDLHEVPIGAIIVDANSAIIAKAHNNTKQSSLATSHAEILAINRACQYFKNNILTNCSIYVTAEPCLMCLGAILHSRIKRIYYGCPEPKYGAIESRYSILDKIHKQTKNFPEIYSNIQEEECKNLLVNFFKKLR